MISFKVGALPDGSVWRSRPSPQSSNHLLASIDDVTTKYCLNCQQTVNAKKGFSWIIFLLLLVAGFGVGGVAYVLYWLIKSKTCPICGQTHFGRPPNQPPQGTQNRPPGGPNQPPRGPPREQQNHGQQHPPGNQNQPPNRNRDGNTNR